MSVCVCMCIQYGGWKVIFIHVSSLGQYAKSPSSSSSSNTHTRTHTQSFTPCHHCNWNEGVWSALHWDSTHSLHYKKHYFITYIMHSAWKRASTVWMQIWVWVRERILVLIHYLVIVWQHHFLKKMDCQKKWQVAKIYSDIFSLTGMHVGTVMWRPVRYNLKSVAHSCQKESGLNID